MAERRMVSKRIVDTDNFLDMPVTSRLLYYDLLVRADDDGFVGSPKKITRMVGASDDDIKLLISKKYLIPFESGVCVIRHWKVHNYINPGRYNETQYLDEKSLLTETSAKSYELLNSGNTSCGQSVLQTSDTGKVSIGQVRKEKYSIGQESARLVSPTQSGFQRGKVNNPFICDTIQYFFKRYKETFAEEHSEIPEERIDLLNKQLGGVERKVVDIYFDRSFYPKERTGNTLIYHFSKDKVLDLCETAVKENEGRYKYREPESTVGKGDYLP
jgi:hypothetical protein